MGIVGRSFLCRPTRGRLILALWGVALAASMARAETVAKVTVLRIDGATYEAVWIGSKDGRSIQLQRDGTTEDVAIDDLERITFGSGEIRELRWPAAVGGTADARQDSESPAAPEPTAPTAPRFALFLLTDGGRLPGHLIEPTEQGDAIFARTPLAEDTRLPFDRVAAVQLGDAALFPRAEEILLATLSDRPAAEDVFITRDAEDVKAPRGRLESLGPAEGAFSFAGRSRGFATEKAYAIVLAAGPTAAAPTRFPMTVRLSDGSVFSGSPERADADALGVSTSLGLSATIRLAEIARLDFVSDRVVYLSDLKPAGEGIEGILHRPWPVRMDRSVAGGPLSIAGRVFEKGVGVHSRTELTYDLGGGFAKFVSTIGLDDAVRPRGSVVYRVSVDGNVAFDSGTVTGAEAARDVIVDVKGAKRMTLVVDYGDGVDLADQADWAGARLLKPPAVRP